MLSRTASRVPLLLAGVLVVTAGVLIGRDSHECDDASTERAGERMQQFSELMQDLTQVRGPRWLAANPDRACPTMDDLTTADERRVQRVAHIGFVCGDREHFGRRIVLTTATTIARNPFAESIY